MSDGDSLYHDEMKKHYQSNEIAEKYDDAFSDQGSFRHRLVAGRERKTVLQLIRQVPHETVIDIPAGTGKLAPVFQRTGSSVLSCDISLDMLQFAEKRYLQLGYTDTDFMACEAESVSSCLNTSYDVAVCLRLLHRVPDDTKQTILTELADVADYAIISFGITSTYHRSRRQIRRWLIGGDDRPDWYLTQSDVKTLLEKQFEVIDQSWILPFLSQEKLFLLRPRD